jgi:FlaA1/EpsC-like NDP-sugar epimerase
MLKIPKYNFDKHYLPRWTVMAFDLVIILLAVFAASKAILDALRNEHSTTDMIILMCYTFTALFISWLIYKPYIGIIRYFSMSDIIRFAKSCLLGILFLLTFLLINNTILNLSSIDYPYSIVIINFFITLFIVVFSRLTVYYLTLNTSNKTINYKSILIYGTGNLAIATRNAVLKFENTFYNVMGFIDNNPLFKNRKISGLPIYTESQAHSMLKGRKRQIDEIFLANDDITDAKIQQNAFIEANMGTNVIFKDVPDITKWNDGTLNSNQIKEIRIEDILGREQILLDLEGISQELLDKKIMVTGATGSIGSEIIRQMLKFKPKKLILIDQAESQLFELQHEIQPMYNEQSTEIHFCLCDTTDKYRLTGLFHEHRPEMIFHASAYKHVPLLEDNPYEAIKNNVISTKILADLAIEYDVFKFVLISTDKAVNPTNVMGASKRICELYVQSFAHDHSVKTKFITTRFGNVIGSSGSVIPLFKKQIEKGGPITVTHKDIIRYLMTIPEASQLVLEACTMGNGGEIYLFDMGKPVKIYDLAIKMIQLSGLVPHKDISIKEIGLRPGEKLYEELINEMENFIPTHNSRILIGTNHSNGNGKIRKEIEVLIEMLKHLSDNELVKRMKFIVPEFISNNSRFSALDEKPVLN